MINRKQILTTAAAITLLTIGAPAAASDNGKLAYDSEVKSCVAAVGNHANYNDATRVRHTVVKIKNTFIVYVLTIDTDVFANSDEIAIREYASYCIAKGDDKPSVPKKPIRPCA